MRRLDGVWKVAALAVPLVLGAYGCSAAGDSTPVEGNRDDSREGLVPPGTAGTLKQGILLIENRPVVTYLEVNGMAFLEGDIVLHPGILEALPDLGAGEESVGESKAALAAGPSSWLWPDGVVPYVIDPNLSYQYRVHDAIAHWEAKTKIRFVPRTNQKDYVVFQPGSGCWSYVGRVGGAQKVELASNCSTGTTIHEIGHVVGAWHEQSRSDRDANVVVYWENIQSGYEYNFQTYVEKKQSGQDVGAYDVDSIMHYYSYAFSRNGYPTIVRKSDHGKIGWKDVLSQGDIAAIAALYGPPPECQPQSACPSTQECGVANDGCGGTIQCGTCPSGSSCEDNVCIPDTCKPLTACPSGVTCGAIDDGCGGQVQCGTCPSGSSCSSSNTCVQTGCEPMTACPSTYECGETADGCGSSISCGTCPSGSTCDGHACVAPTCEPLTQCPIFADCGTIDDGCGGTLDCGTCKSGQVCEDNDCNYCKPLKACPSGYQCGEIDDGCGGKLSCGTCASGSTCEGNTCKAPTCEPLTACPETYECGSISDGCGGYVKCGKCALPERCSKKMCKLLL